jgi:hypothetical protein
MMEKFKVNLIMSSWERDYLNDKELFIQVENSLLDFAADVVMWNLEDDDPSNVRNFVPTYLKLSMTKMKSVLHHLILTVMLMDWLGYGVRS